MRGNTVWAVTQESFRLKVLQTNIANYCRFRERLHIVLECLGLDVQHARHRVELFARTHRPQARISNGFAIRLRIVVSSQLVLHALGSDVWLQIVRMLSPDTFGSLNGGSLFDHTLLPLLELSRPVFVSILSGWMAYFRCNGATGFLRSYA